MVARTSTGTFGIPGVHLIMRLTQIFKNTRD